MVDLDIINKSKTVTAGPNAILPRELYKHRHCFLNHKTRRQIKNPGNLFSTFVSCGDGIGINGRFFKGPAGR